jgi:hypothetical protein
MDSAELNEIKGTQFGQFVTLIIFLEKIWWNQRHTPSHMILIIFLGKIWWYEYKGIAGRARVRKNLIPQPAP